MLLMIMTASAFGADAEMIKTLQNELKKGTAVLIDVREESEVKDGKIKGAVWFPLSKMESDPNWFNDFEKKTKGKNIFLYCRSGNRSGKVKNLLQDKGLKAHNAGGYEDLRKDLGSDK